MTKNEYIKYALKNGYFKKLKWYFSLFTLPTEDNESNEYIRYDNNMPLVYVNNNYIKLEDTFKNIPVLTIYDKYTINKDDLNNVDKELESRLGLIIANYILLDVPFKNKIPYINSSFSIKDIENTIKEKLSNTPKDNEISVKEYNKFANNAMFLVSLSKIVSISATFKGILPPPGIIAYKKKLIKEFKEKYGEDVFKDYTKVSELETLLKKYDDEWLKDDPSYGKMLSGKVKNVSRAKLFLTYGAEVAFDKKGIATMVENSLLEGWPDDPEQLVNIYNASRAGSYDRGKETQNGGVAAKVILRATNSIKILNKDCGSKIGLDINITKDNIDSLYGRYILNNGKPKLFTKEDKDKYLNKTVVFRSPSYCLIKDNNICKVCGGEELYNRKDGVSLLLLQLSATLLDISLASMHAQILVTKKYDKNDSIS